MDNERDKFFSRSKTGSVEFITVFRLYIFQDLSNSTTITMSSIGGSYLPVLVPNGR